eukprot:1448491-Pyramimonas_sp.AAC.1
MELDAAEGRRRFLDRFEFHSLWETEEVSAARRLAGARPRRGSRSGSLPRAQWRQSTASIGALREIVDCVGGSSGLNIQSRSSWASLRASLAFRCRKSPGCLTFSR